MFQKSKLFVKKYEREICLTTMYAFALGMAYYKVLFEIERGTNSETTTAIRQLDLQDEIATQKLMNLVDSLS